MNPWKPTYALIVVWCIYHFTDFHRFKYTFLPLVSAGTRTDTKGYDMFLIMIFYVISLSRCFKYQSVTRKVLKLILRVANMKQFTEKIAVIAARLRFSSRHICWYLLEATWFWLVDLMPNFDPDFSFHKINHQFFSTKIYTFTKKPIKKIFLKQKLNFLFVVTKYFKITNYIGFVILLYCVITWFENGRRH